MPEQRVAEPEQPVEKLVNSAAEQVAVKPLAPPSLHLPWASQLAWPVLEQDVLY